VATAASLQESLLILVIRRDIDGGIVQRTPKNSFLMISINWFTMDYDLGWVRIRLALISALIAIRALDAVFTSQNTNCSTLPPAFLAFDSE
jgi:hypothetical protein